MELAVGQVVQLADGRQGVIRFVGQTLFAPGGWVGVELEAPTGKNDGSVQGERYFDCRVGHGMFLRPTAVTIVALQAEDGAEEPGNDVPKPRTATAAARPSVGAGRRTANSRPSSRPSSVVTSSRTSAVGSDAGMARRMSLNAPSPSPGPRSRPSSMSRSPTKSPTKQLATGPSSTSTSRTGTPSNTGVSNRLSSTTARTRPSVGTSRTSMGPPPVPAARSGRAPSIASSSVTNARPTSGARGTGGKLGLGGPGVSKSGTRPSSLRVSSGESGNESTGSGRTGVGEARGSIDGRITSPPKSSDDEILSPQPTSPVRSRAAALEKLTAAAARPADVAGSNHKQPAVEPPQAASTRQPATNTAAHREIEDLKAKLRVLDRKRMEDRDKIKQLDKLQADCEKYQGIIQKIQTKYQPQQQENNELRKQLKQAEAKLESVEGLQAEHETVLELATLDREMAEETAEVYKAELEAAKLKNEELELEAEELRLENAEFTQGMTPEEKASAGWLQMERNNERLREALIRLRDISQQQEEGLRDQIKSLEDDMQDLGQVKEQQEATKEKLTQAEAAVEDLRQQLDAAQAADDMIMELTERNMTQAEQMEELKAVIEDLENLKEINDELEVNHVQNEREMQEEIDFNAAIIQEQARRAAQQESTLEDMEYALSRFREMVTGLQSDLEDMRASHAVTENESEQLNSKSRAMMDLNMKLQLSAAKAQVKTIDLELRHMEAQEAEQHLEIVKMFLPDAYLQTDRNSVLALLRFRRLAFKANLLNGFVRERINQAPHPGHEDDVFAGCDVVDKLTWVAAMCERFAGAISRCSADEFGRFDGALYELEPVERALNGWIDGLRRGELKEQTCADELQRSIALMSHLAEMHLSPDAKQQRSQNSRPTSSATSGNKRTTSSIDDDEHEGQDLEGFADNLHMRAILVQSHLDSAALALHTARSMVQRVIPPAGDTDEEAQYFARRAETAIAQTRSAKVVAGKAVRALEELKTRSLSLMPDTLVAFEQCEAASQTLAELARKTGFELHTLLHEEGRTEPYTYAEVQTVAHKAALAIAQAVAAASAASSATGSGSTAAAATMTVTDTNEELFAAYTNKLRMVASQVSDLSSLSSDLSQTLEFERPMAPWVARSQEIKAPKTVPVDAEEELRRLKEEHAEARRVIARRENDLGTAQLRIDTLESKMRDAQTKASTIADLERTVAGEQVVSKQLKEDVEKQDRELKTLEADRDRWKKIASDTRLLVGDDGVDEDGVAGDGTATAGGSGGGAGSRQTARSKERAVATAREMEVLKSEITSLQAAVRYLREDNRRARLTEQHHYEWLAEPLRKKTREQQQAEARAPLVAKEARDVLGALVEMAASAQVYDLGAQLPADRLAWRPSKTSPGYYAAKMEEDYAAWKGWQASVVRKARDVTNSSGSGGQPKPFGSAAANRRQARKEAVVRLRQVRLPDTAGGPADKSQDRVMDHGGGAVRIVGVGTQQWWDDQVHIDDRSVYT